MPDAAAAEPRPSVGLRRLAGASVTYGLGSVLSRGLAFLLLPVYTRHLTDADYGIVAVTATVSSVLGVVYPLGLQSAVWRLNVAAAGDEERRAVNGTVWIASLVAAAVMALLLDQLGAPFFHALLPAVPFDPYIRLAIWTSLLAALGLVPLNMLQVQERPKAYVALSFGASLLTTAGIVLLVVFRNEGAIGYLRGALFGAVLAAPLYLAVGLRNVTVTVRRTVLVAALAYSLPLVPHALAGWLLELSHRAILSRFVPLGDVGVFAVGYQLGAALSIVISAFTSAWLPILFRELAKEDPAADRELARLATYFVAVFLFMAGGWALVAPHAITWLLAPAYAGAWRVTQIVVAAYGLNALYILPIGLMLWRKTTWLVPVVTVAAGSANVALNLLLVPRFGATAAAWNTLAGYGVMLLLAWLLARRQYPFPYEYGRLARIVVIAAVLFVLASLAAPAITPASLVLRAVLWLTFPVGLLAGGVIRRDQVGHVLAVLRRRVA